MLIGYGLANMYLCSLNFVKVKGVQRIAKFMQHHVGGIHDVVDGLHPNGTKLFLCPRWTWCDGHMSQFNGEVVGAIFFGLDIELNAASAGQGLFQGSRLWKR